MFLNKSFFSKKSNKCGQSNKRLRLDTYKKTINVDSGFLCGHGTKFSKTINVDPRLFDSEEYLGGMKNAVQSL